MKAPPLRHPASVCLLPSEFPPSPCLRPQALAPVQSLTLALRSGRTSEMAVAAPGGGRWSFRRLQIRLSGSPLPGLS